MKPNFPIVLLLLGTVLLNACASRQPVPAIDNWQEHRERMARLDHWQITGKLGIRMPGDNNSANLRWLQQAGDFKVDLSGPFGQGRVVISGDQHLVSLEQSGSPTRYADTSETLIWEATGWLLPLEDLRYWVRGIPAPGKPIHRSQTNDQGLLEQLEQSSWQLSYSHYTLAGGLPLPGRILAQRQDVRVLLVIRQWDIQSGQENLNDPL